ncbi:MAG: hypothetical protein K8R73_05735, partial [Clostridiales bacterium]|nr:hypothetical protein [Clostridiales bacterium]
TRIPIGFTPEELGDVGYLIEPELEPEETDCFIISYLQSPITKDTPNVYVVCISAVLSDGSDLDIATRPLMYTWTASEKVNPEEPTQLNRFVHAPETYENQTITVEIRDANGAFLRRLQIQQTVKRPNQLLWYLHKLTEDMDQSILDSIVKNLPFGPSLLYLLDRKPILGDPDTMAIMLNDLSGLIDSVFDSVESTKKVPKSLLTAIIYSSVMERVKINEYSPEIFENVSPFKYNKIVQGEINNSTWWVGLCNTPLLTTAMFTGNEGIDSDSTYIPWHNVSGLLLIDDIIEDLAELFGPGPVDDFQELDEDIRKNLLEILLFPKLSIKICYQLLCCLKDRRFKEMDSSDFIASDDSVGDIIMEYYYGPVEINQPVHGPDILSGGIGYNTFKLIISTPYIDLISSYGLGARTIDAFVGSDGTIQSIEDKYHRNFLWPITESINPTWNEEHFGWTPNIDSTIREAMKNELIIIDAGYWGHYNLDPQRDFALVEGHYTWLCRLMPVGTPGLLNETKWYLRYCPIALSLVEMLYNDWGYYIEIVSHAEIKNAPEDVQPSTNVLTVIFPDLHLPEKWPDLPPNDQDNKYYHPDPVARAELRKQLLLSQHFNFTPGDADFLSSAPLERLKQLSIQNYLKDFHQYRTVNNELKDSVVAINNFTVGSSQFTARQFETERILVDRKLRTYSSWFYPLLNYSNDSYQILEGYIDQNIEDNLNGDATPAIDLASMLSVIKELLQHNNAVNVVQVGDLYEMWLNQEWLYLPFSYDGEPNSEDLLNAIKLFAIHFGTLSFDWCQYRLNEKWKNWYNSLQPNASEKSNTLDDIDHDIPEPYIFHGWPINSAIRRYKTGNSIDFEVNNADAERAKEIVQSRVQSIKNFCLPKPSGGLDSTRE